MIIKHATIFLLLNSYFVFRDGFQVVDLNAIAVGMLVVSLWHYPRL